MGRIIALTGLFLVIGVRYTPGYSQSFDDARAFSRDVVVNLFDKDRAAVLPPLTTEMQRYVHIRDDKVLIDRAAKDGPVTSVTRIDCEEQDKTSPDRCTGKLSICSLDGSLRSGPMTAKVAACYSLSKRWELDSVMLNFLEPSDSRSLKDTTK